MVKEQFDATKWVPAGNWPDVQAVWEGGRKVPESAENKIQPEFDPVDPNWNKLQNVGDWNPTRVRIGKSPNGGAIGLPVTLNQEVEARTGLEPVYTALQAGA